MKQRRYLGILSVLFFAVLIWSAVKPKDYFTWILEVSPGIAGFAVLVLTYRRFKFTNLLYALMLVHCLILFVGGHYTYAEVPFFDWIKELVGGTRNNYDKIGHFAQGFVPAMIARELILRLKVTVSRAWMNYFAVSSALAISALYELIEWCAALLTGESSQAFLGTQGYVWDTQSDMFLALVGSVMALVLFSKYHDAKMKEIGGKI
jgi:putative membrane protein